TLGLRRRADPMSISVSVSAMRVEFIHAARRLLRSPAFATVVTAMLAVGIGANTAMFALMDALLFRQPMHVGRPDQLVRILFRSDDSPQALSQDQSDFPTYRDVIASGAF